MSLSFTVSPPPPTASPPTCSRSPSARAPALGPGADAVDAALDGGLAAFLAEAGFEGKLGETLAVPTGGRLKAKAAVLVGIGDPAELTVDGLRRAAAAIARRASKAASVATTLADRRHRARRSPTPRRPSPRASCSARYQYLEYKGDATPSKLQEGHGHRGGRRGGAAPRSSRGATIGDAVTWARDLVNTPSKEKSPADVVAAARKLLRGTRRHRAGARREAARRRSAWAACSASARVRSRRRASSS